VSIAPRVLLGNLEPMVRIGMTTVLGEEGIDVIGTEERPQALLLMAGRLRPDAVVLDLGHATSRDLAARVRATCPETTVVLWARDEEAMEVVRPGASSPRRVPTPVPADLCGELVSSQVNRVEG
jgi:DNA-binding NarL/FixJ family response regulator